MLKKYISIEITSVSDFFSLKKQRLFPFIFRGQSNINWELSSSIERVNNKYKIHSYSKDFQTEERWMLHDFRRKVHLYMSTKIEKDNHFEWLALMQHHGSPTRLLDFTRSIYIALFFAIIDGVEDSCIWAINVHTLRDNLLKNGDVNYSKNEALKDEVNKHHINYANKFIDKRSIGTFPSTIIPLEPILLSERLSKQQGLFLMPTNPKVSFNKNLSGAFNEKEIQYSGMGISEFLEISDSNDIRIIKFKISQSIYKELLKLLVEMNITFEILFPGIDGLAKSLEQIHMRNR